MQQHGTGEQAGRKLTVDEFLAVFSTDLLETEDHVELIDGKIVAMSPPNPPHMMTTERLDDDLRRAYGRGYRVVVQGSWLASRWSLPQPDIAVLRGGRRAFDNRFPTGKDTVLIVEVSQSSRRRDLEKVLVYARAGAPTYWRFDIESRTLEVYEKPSRRGYLLTTELAASERVRVPGTRKVLKVGDVLPARPRRTH